ncbi:MAG: site-specific tyrosine recombinase [Gemmataceae bacterium]|nr:site-specific tyrosine recombinase [Gemmataceae bacterium]
MPHFPKPFFKTGRGVWYVEIDRQQYNLGSDKDAAFERYHELMRDRPREADLTLALGVMDAFLTWANEHKAPRTFEWYQRHLKAFARSIPSLLPVGQLKKHHLTSCLRAQTASNSTTQNGLCRAVVRAFRWAENEEIIHRSPFRGVEKPTTRRRTVVIPEEDYQFMLSRIPSQNIRLLLEAAWHTAARPQELAAVEARHVDVKNGRWVFPAEESKGKRFPRVVYLNDRGLEITRQLAERYPSGKLFRNSDGEPWNRHSVACVFGRLQVDLGMRAMKTLGVTVEKPPRFNKTAFADRASLEAARADQARVLYERRKAVHKLARTHAPKFSLYHFRHTWCQRALKAGVDPLTVGILMGHQDPSTIAKVYQHLALDPDFLRKALARATSA